MARDDGLAPEAIARAFATFPGVRRRLEELGEARGVIVVEDFAHHPSAVGESIRGLRQRYPGRRLAVLYEPRSLTAGRALLEDAYLEALGNADRVLLAPLFHEERLAPEERLDLGSLASRLEGCGVEASRHASLDDLLPAALAWLEEGDVVVTMSSGAFGNLPRRLLAVLAEEPRERAAEPSTTPG